MAVGSGIFTIPEFINRNVLKLAPDAFVAINGSIGMRIISPTNITNVEKLDTRGGISSINVTSAVYPPGSNKCSLDIIAPMYKSLHEDYYTTMPNGTRRSILSPMMEVKVFMKGRFLQDGNPKYYPVFWGLITEVSEDYSGGVFRITVTCEDYLTWWKYQRITLSPATLRTVYGGPIPEYFPSIFLNSSPWQIIYQLCSNTNFVDSNGKSFNFVYPDFSNQGKFAPDFGKLSNSQVGELFNAINSQAISYWQKRFGKGVSSPQEASDRVPLEMYGLVGPITIDQNLIDLFSYDPKKRDYSQTDLSATLDMNFNILARIQPFGALNLYGDGSESLEYSKLEIATQICEQTQMEFFVDTNGSLVFKPPFYNLDVLRGGVPYYVVDSSDLVNFNSSVNSNNICTYLEAHAPKRYDLPELDSIGYHIDYELLQRFGLRYQKINMRYGNDARTVRLLAAAEMTKINGRAYTGSATIPLRPEMRLGYPVYITHLDAYYYVTGISHTVAFGSSASTTLSLEYRRDRMFSPGDTYNIRGKDNTNVGSVNMPAGGILNGYVHAFVADKTNLSVPENAIANVDEKLRTMTDKLTQEGIQGKDVANEYSIYQNELVKRQILQDSGVISGPKFNGMYEIAKAANSPIKIYSQRPDGKDAVVSNELLMITDETVPYTDLNGYRHIGAFPYGANLVLSLDGSSFIDTTTPDGKVTVDVDKIIYSSPEQGNDVVGNSAVGYEQSPGQAPPTNTVEGGKVLEVTSTPEDTNKDAEKDALMKDPKYAPQTISDQAIPVDKIDNQTDAVLDASPNDGSSLVPGH